MSRSGIVVAGLALLLAAGALVLQFVLPQDGGNAGADVEALQSQIDELKNASGSSSDLRIAFIDAEEAFTVFLDAVSDLRQNAADKRDEIVSLQQEFVASTISREEYEQRYNELQVELLDAQLTIDVGTIEKMIGSSAFTDVRTELQRWREEAQPIVDEVKNLVSTVRVGVIDPAEFQSRFAQVQSAFSQFDQLLTQVATTRIVAAAQKVALAEGFDLVLRQENVIIFGNSATVINITDLVKSEISSYL